MKSDRNWKEFWEGKFSSTASNSEADRQDSGRGECVEKLAEAELFEFIDARPGELVFDAGCGTGANVVMIHSVVRWIVAMDFAESAIQRAKLRAASVGVNNAELIVGDITGSSLPEGPFDRVLCLSVFHYLSDDQVRACLRSFANLLKPEGVIVLHVKNLSSPYLSTLHAMKKVRRLFGAKDHIVEYFRTFHWYVDELRQAGFDVMYYNSFNLLYIEGLPACFVRKFRRLELNSRLRFPFRTASLRKLGADLKFRARRRIS